MVHGRPGACNANPDKSSDKSNAAPGRQDLIRQRRGGTLHHRPGQERQIGGIKTEQYSYEAVRELPHFREKSGAYISLLRRFLRDSKANMIRIMNTDAHNINRVYHGFYASVQRHRLEKQIAVKRYGDELYIIKIKGEEEHE